MLALEFAKLQFNHFTYEITFFKVNGHLSVLIAPKYSQIQVIYENMSDFIHSFDFISHVAHLHLAEVKIRDKNFINFTTTKSSLPGANTEDHKIKLHSFILI